MVRFLASALKPGIQMRLGDSTVNSEFIRGTCCEYEGTRVFRLSTQKRQQVSNTTASRLRSSGSVEVPDGSAH